MRVEDSLWATHSSEVIRQRIRVMIAARSNLGTVIQAGLGHELSHRASFRYVSVPIMTRSSLQDASPDGVVVSHAA